MIYHPLIIVILSSLFFLMSIKNKFIFSCIAIIYPIILGYNIFILPNALELIQIYNLNLIADFSSINKLIAFSIIVVLFSSNIYALGQKKISEIILGALYGGFSLSAIFAGDFFSLFVSIELMMIFSAIIIFIGKNKGSSSFLAAKKYFFTHVCSSNMILIGIIYLVNKNNSIQIFSLTQLMDGPYYSKAILLIMLSGLLINIAVFPFSGWMINFYQLSSPSGFLYLITFTTKVSVCILIKLFFGLHLLQYIAFITIIYIGIKALFEDNLLALLCSLSIMSMGFLLIVVSNGNIEAINSTICYLFIHIIYKSLLTILVVVLIDHGNVILSKQIVKFNSPILIFSLFIAICTMINMPFTSILSIKTALTTYSSSMLEDYFILLSSIMTTASIPWKQFYNAIRQRSTGLDLNIYSKLSIYFMLSLLIVITFFWQYIPYLSSIFFLEPIKIQYIKKQLILVVIGIISSIFFQKYKYSSYYLNFLENIASYFFSFIKILMLIATQCKNVNIINFEQRFVIKLANMFNQQTAVFLLFLTFIILLFVACFYY